MPSFPGQRSKVKTRRDLIALEFHKPPLTDKSEFSPILLVLKMLTNRKKYVYTIGFVICDIML